MTLTIITACFNSVAVIRTAMESVLAQTWPEVEYLVIDGGSTDGTVDVLREFEPKFGGRMRWVSEKDRGMYDAINKGIRMATGEVVGTLNADDVLSDDEVIARVAEAFGGEATANCANRANGEVYGDPDLQTDERMNPRTNALLEVSRQDAKTQSVLNPVVRPMEQARSAIEPWNPIPSGSAAMEPGRRPVDLVYGDIRFVANREGVGLEGVRSEKTVRYYSARHWRPWMLQWGFMPPHPSVYIRKACFGRLGDYALDYKIAADYALLIRFLRKAKLRCRYVPMCFVDMRVGGVSTRSWRSNWVLNQEIVRGNREAGYFCCLTMLLPKYAFKVFEFVGPKVKRFKRA